MAVLRQGVLGRRKQRVLAVRAPVRFEPVVRHELATRPDDGFAAVDALVALMILTVTIVLTLSAVSTARQASERAEETRKALVLMRTLIETPPVREGSLSGRLDGFDWRMATSARQGETAIPSVRVCERSVTAQAQASGRHYDLATAKICSSEDAAS